MRLLVVDASVPLSREGNKGMNGKHGSYHTNIPGL
jgi:hypothetical protein